jgi:hypothetical protein
MTRKKISRMNNVSPYSRKMQINQVEKREAPPERKRRVCDRYSYVIYPEKHPSHEITRNFLLLIKGNLKRDNLFL